jgi:hypothetical protein
VRLAKSAGDAAIQRRRAGPAGSYRRGRARENRLDTEHGGAGALSFVGGFGLDGLDECRDARPIKLRRNRFQALLRRATPRQ